LIIISLTFNGIVNDPIDPDELKELAGLILPELGNVCIALVENPRALGKLLMTGAPTTLRSRLTENFPT
jgi:hypothetical protein